jgi:hypothetical protein
MPNELNTPPTKAIDDYEANELVPITCDCAQRDPPPPRCWLKVKLVIKTGKKFLSCPNWPNGCDKTMRWDQFKKFLDPDTDAAQRSLIQSVRYNHEIPMLQEDILFPRVNHDNADRYGLNRMIATSSDPSKWTELPRLGKPVFTEEDCALIESQGIKWQIKIVQEEMARHKAAGNNPGSTVATAFEYPPTNIKRAGVIWLCETLVAAGYSVPRQVSRAGSSSGLDGWGAFPKSNKEFVLEWMDARTRKVHNYDFRIMYQYKWYNVRVLDLWAPESVVAFQLNDMNPEGYGWLFGGADWFLVPNTVMPSPVNIGDWLVVDAARIREAFLTRASFVKEMPTNYRTCRFAELDLSQFADETTFVADQPLPPSHSFPDKECGTCASSMNCVLHGPVEMIGGLGGPELDEANSLDLTFYKVNVSNATYRDVYMVANIDSFHEWCLANGADVGLGSE